MRFFGWLIYIYNWVPFYPKRSLIIIIKSTINSVDFWKKRNNYIHDLDYRLEPTHVVLNIIVQCVEDWVKLGSHPCWICLQTTLPLCNYCVFCLVYIYIHGVYFIQKNVSHFKSWLDLTINAVDFEKKEIIVLLDEETHRHPFSFLNDEYKCECRKATFMSFKLRKNYLKNRIRRS